MDSRPYTLFVALLICSAGAALPDALLAQARAGETTRATPNALEPLSVSGGDLRQLVQASRGEQRVARRTPIRSLSAAEKAEALRVSLNLQALEPSGIGASLRLTAHQPYAANQGFIDAHHAKFVGGETSDGFWILEPRVKPASAQAPTESLGAQFGARLAKVLSDMAAPRVELYFKPSVANQPLLLDFGVRLHQQVPLVFTLYISGGTDWLKQETSLSSAGNHHILAIVVPKNTDWYSVVLLPERDSNTAPNWVDVDYVEITAMK